MKNLNKKIAAAIQLAHKSHEESYIKQYDSANEWIGGDYSISWELCWQQACSAHDLPGDLGYFLDLANHWFNDIQWWADQVLSGEPQGFSTAEVPHEEFTADDIASRPDEEIVD